MNAAGKLQEARVSVKICGLSSPETIRSIAGLPIDQIGFMFAPSRRQVAPELAGELTALLKAGYAAAGQACPEAVGVFVRPTRQQLLDTVAAVPLDVIQLHSEAPLEDCRFIKTQLGLKIYKVISVSSASDPTRHTADLEPYAGWIDAVLLDTYDPAVSGGTGVRFAWDCIPHYLRWTRQAGLKLIVAGGLDADNVAQLLANYGPDGVDVSSGVETGGLKDTAKIKAFVERVKGL